MNFEFMPELTFKFGYNYTLWLIAIVYDDVNCFLVHYTFIILPFKLKNNGPSNTF